MIYENYNLISWETMSCFLCGFSYRRETYIPLEVNLDGDEMVVPIHIACKYEYIKEKIEI